MTSGKYQASDYVEVADRLQAFFGRYPEGSLQTDPPTFMEIGGQQWVLIRALAYRTAEDPRPGVGTAWELIPGRTPFTKGSEVMVGETSAWGRAMAALGIATKKGIATGHEVRMAKARQEPPPQPASGPDPITEAIGAATTTEQLDALVEAIKGSENPAKYRGLWSKRHKEVSA